MSITKTKAIMEKFNELDWYRNALQSQLKPCPLCGSEDIKLHLKPEEGKENIRCLSCGVEITRNLGIGVVGVWNKRVNK